MEQMPKMEQAPENDLDLTPEERKFMEKAKMTPAELTKFKRWEALAKEMHVDLAA